MRYVLWLLILFGAFVVGTFGFCQIVGTIKYFKYRSPGLLAVTLLIWLAILGFGAFAVLTWLNNYKAALFIGYAISFLLSFNVKPDNA